MLKNYLNKYVKVIIDRPLNSKHPKFNFIYEINYGYLENTVSGDNEEIDAYILDCDKPIKEYFGKVIAVIHRKNDVEDKLVVANKDFSKEEIIKLTKFQEKYFDIEIIM